MRFLPLPARIEIRLSGGRQFSKYCDLASGSPQKSMGREARLAKVRDLTHDLFGATAQVQLIERTESLETLADINLLLDGL